MAKHFERVTFTGSLGDTLSARLDRPEGQIRAVAMFAHCFTCSKDIFAAARISQGLTAAGFAVFRFDFTGLGQSGGDFANTNFSSNVADLVAAADHLRGTIGAPQILIGHSLGGAAVVKAALDMPEVQAVATIGAPAEATHVAENFRANVGEIEEKGVATVELAGRPFSIKKQFLDDLKTQSVTQAVARLRKPFLVMHAPLDQTVGIENAGELFMAARHPKSFVSLDTADHLLSEKSDAAYAAQVLAAWASRYIDLEAPASETRDMPAPVDGGVVVRETRNGKFQQDVVVGPHLQFADEPKSFGGDETGPSPYEFVSAGLGACTSMTMRMYADRKQWPVERISVTVRHNKIHAEDCDTCDTDTNAKVDQFARDIEIEGDLTSEQLEKLMEIADKCPVHRTLNAPVHIPTQRVTDT